MPYYKILAPPLTVKDKSARGGFRKIYEGSVEMSAEEAAPIVALGVIALGVTEEVSLQNAEIDNNSSQAEHVSITVNGDGSGAKLPPTEKVQITTAPKTAPAITDDAAQVDINQASEEQLIAIKHIGKVLAGRIIKARTAKPFESIEELDQILELPPEKMAEIKDQISF